MQYKTNKQTKQLKKKNQITKLEEGKEKTRTVKTQRGKLDPMKYFPTSLRTKGIWVFGERVTDTYYLPDPRLDSFTYFNFISDPTMSI